MNLKNYIDFVVLLFILAGCSVSENTNMIGNKVAEAGYIKEVTDVEDRWMKALAKRDTSSLSQLLAPAFTLSASSAEIETRKQYLETAASQDRQLEPIILEDRHFHVYSQTIISTGKTAYIGRWKDNSFKIPVRYTNVFVKDRDTWKAAASHFSIIN